MWLRNRYSYNLECSGMAPLHLNISIDILSIDQSIQEHWNQATEIRYAYGTNNMKLVTHPWLKDQRAMLKLR